jgi:hypothetical protein
LKVKNFEALNSKISALSGCLSEICNEKWFFFLWRT